MRRELAILAAVAACALTRVEAQGDAVQICVGADRVLRVAEGGACKPGERALGVIGSATRSAAPDTADSQRRLKQLEDRIRNLEQAADRTSLGHQRVSAPFMVIDRAGRMILSVSAEPTPELSLYNTAGNLVAIIRAEEGGGQFVGLEAQGKRKSWLSATTDFDGLGSQEDGQTRVELGRGNKGNYRLTFKNAAGNLLAALGQGSGSGTGAAFVGDAKGAAGVDLKFDERGDPHIAILSGQNIPVAQLSQESDGSGSLLLTNASGTPMVDAGVITGSFGVVRAGPGACRSGFGVLGLPGSYISGKPDK